MSVLTIALVGNPNCGKSTLFNELTGARQKVGNWPGVTVECKLGHYIQNNHQITVVDLPGVYQLSQSADDLQAMDERIACEFLLKRQADLIVNVIDAVHLERHLYLTLQLLAMKVPLIIAVNMMDVAKRRQIELDLLKLETLLGCPVVGLIANKGKGVAELKKQITSYSDAKNRETKLIETPSCLARATNLIAELIKKEHPELAHCANWTAEQLLQNNNQDFHLNSAIREMVALLKKEVENELGEELDLIFADIFYTASHHISQCVSVQNNQGKTLTERVDKVILNRFLGIPIFLAIMYTMFLFAINLGGAFQDFFDIASDTIFVQGTTQLLNQLHAPNWLIALLAAGFGRGINTTISFVPVIGGMFLFLGLLEGSGYMARASFVIDRFMRLLGLPGKSFVPMIVGFGCNVPAILAARTLEDARDRTLTILMSPFMSCGARLAIFAVFIAAFFPTGGQNVVFLLYFIGIATAVLTGLALRKTVLKGNLSPLVLELPAYHLPSFSSLLQLTWQRLKSFVLRAGKLIVPICMLIGILNSINIDGSLTSEKSSSTSLLSSIGRVITPVFAPMGIQQDNWPATVGLVTGILAKEVVVATLNTLYTQDAHLENSENYSASGGSIKEGLKAAAMSVPINLSALKNSFANPVVASAPSHTLNHHVYGIMYAKFSGQIGAFSYLLFVLLYFPCISATAVMAKELNKKWTLFSVAWSTAIAYGVATCFYQLATFSSHPKQSSILITTIITFFICILSMMKKQRVTVRGEARVCC